MDSYVDSAIHQDFEAQITVDNKVKKEAFWAMEQLQGWCSQNKASILIDFVLTNKPLVVVEIGVFGGKSLVPMAYALRENGRGIIYGIDPWNAADSTEANDGENFLWWSSLDHEKILRNLQAKIKEFDLGKYIELIRLSSKNAPAIPNIDMLHIDGNHSEVTSCFDVCKWVPLVKKGGYIIFDDINWPTTQAAVKLLNTQATKIGEFNDRDSTWGVWVKL